MINNNNIWLNVMIFAFIIMNQYLLPKLTRKDILFSIRIPISKINNEALKKIEKSYQKSVLFLLSPISLLIALFVNPETQPGIFVSSVFMIIILGLVRFYQARKRVQLLKEKEGWVFENKQVKIADTRTIKNDKLPSPLWFMLSVLIVIGNFIFVKANYDLMPSEIPIHWDSQGMATRTIAKTETSVLLLPGYQLMILLIMIFAFFSIIKSKSQIDIEDPEGSKVRNFIFKKRWAMVMIALTFLLQGLFTTLTLMTANVIEISSSMFSQLFFFVIVFILASVLLVAYTTGQGGSRLSKKRVEESNEMNRDDDAYWKLGFFYVNKKDPSLFIEKRFGVGFTINFGNPMAWVLVVGLLGLIAIMAGLPSIL